MDWIKYGQQGAAVFAVFGMLAAPCLAAEDALPPSTLPIQDVAMDEGNSLRLNVPLTKGTTPQQVLLLQSGEIVAKLSPDDVGDCHVRLQRGGIYQVVYNEVTTNIRVWTSSAAPPRTADQLKLVDAIQVRGQQPLPPYTRVNPWVVAGVVAAAVAIPVVIHNNRNDRRNGS